MTRRDQSVLTLLQGVDPGKRTPFCPDDQQLAEYFQGDLDFPESLVLQRHFVDCRYCRALVGVIERSRLDQATTRVPEDLIAQAKQLRGARPGRRIRKATAWAAAAAIVAGMFAMVQFGPNSIPGGDRYSDDVLDAPDAMRSLRSVEPLERALQVRAPLDEARIPPGSLIEWDEVPGRLFYDISVLSDEGDVLAAIRTEGTSWTLDRALPLQSGSTYFVRIAARLPDGRSVSSRHIRFQVGEQN